MKLLYVVLIGVTALVVGILIGRMSAKPKQLTTTTTTTTPAVTVPVTTPAV